MNIVRFKYVIFFLLFSCFSCANEHSHEQKGNVSKKVVTIATAANVQFAMEEIVAAFEIDFDTNVKTIIGSSGKLTAQIKQGAPFDVLVSANMKYPNTLFQEGHASSAPKIYALGSLVVWTLYPDLPLDNPIELLKQATIKKIGIANPNNAPYGQQAVNAFKYYGLYETIKSKLVYGESIAQTNQYIVTKNCEVGLTATSVVMAPNIKDKGHWVAMPKESYQPIQQGVIITKYGIDNNKDNATAFYQFLFSEKAQSIFKKYGYTIPSPR